MNEPALYVRDLSKEFVTQAEVLRILRGVDMALGAGRTAAITGESGSGKSTLLSIIGGLDRATSGTVVSGPFDLSSLDEDGLTQYRRKRVGFIFQFHYLLRDLTALENVMIAGFLGGLPKKEARDRAKIILDDVGLGHRLGHYPSQLSGGERQRAAVARSLVNDPEIIMADEPTGNLDESNSIIVADILFEEVTKRGKSLVLVTHDKALASSCDDVYLLREGRLERP
jgi:lipoprotein-releasing system ATP-binding protein